MPAKKLIVPNHSSGKSVLQNTFVWSLKVFLFLSWPPGLLVATSELVYDEVSMVSCKVRAFSNKVLMASKDVYPSWENKEPSKPRDENSVFVQVFHPWLESLTSSKWNVSFLHFQKSNMLSGVSQDYHCRKVQLFQISCGPDCRARKPFQKLQSVSENQAFDTAFKVTLPEQQSLQSTPERKGKCCVSKKASFEHTYERERIQ